ncbi:MAG: hypothetical protein IT169_06080 [Bryobacterales bacterium]|nr:hypothetical protein [Bryobacterales bacterium]
MQTRAFAQEGVSHAATGDLRVAYTSFSRYDGGAPMPQPITFLPGDQVVFRAKVSGFRIAEIGYQEFRVKLSYEMSAVDFRGLAIGKLKKGELDEPVHKEDKEWLPTLDYKFLIPAMAEYGSARIHLRIRDEVSQKEAVFEETILINGKRLPVLNSVSVIDFGFYRRQEDRSPLPAGVYRAGDTLWAKFDLAGFRIEDQNHFHAECDVQVRDAEGKVLFEQPGAISRDARPEYPERYLPGTFSLEIRPGTSKGKYSVAVIAHDRLSGQSSESVFPFTID